MYKIKHLWTGRLRGFGFKKLTEFDCGMLPLQQVSLWHVLEIFRNYINMGMK